VFYNYQQAVDRESVSSRIRDIDAWIYAPEKDKWEYLLQIEAILASLQCGPGGGRSQALERTSPYSQSERCPEASVFVNTQQ